MVVGGVVVVGGSEVGGMAGGEVDGGVDEVGREVVSGGDVVVVGSSNRERASWADRSEMTRPAPTRATAVADRPPE